MNRRARCLLSLAVVAGACLGTGRVVRADDAFAAAGAVSSREHLLMDAGWKFYLGDLGFEENIINAGVNEGPAGSKFNDSQWRTLNLPHDWAVELPFDQAADGGHGYKPVGPGFPANNIGWYRRSFTLSQADKGKRLWLEFGGVYRDCEVFLNGYKLIHHEAGYNSFRCDVSDVANYGGRNVVAVRVDASKFEGWFYEGAGIYRHVWLEKTVAAGHRAGWDFCLQRISEQRAGRRRDDSSADAVGQPGNERGERHREMADFRSGGQSRCHGAGFGEVGGGNARRKLSRRRRFPRRNCGRRKPQNFTSS